RAPRQRPLRTATRPLAGPHGDRGRADGGRICHDLALELFDWRSARKCQPSSGGASRAGDCIRGPNDSAKTHHARVVPNSDTRVIWPWARLRMSEQKHVSKIKILMRLIPTLAITSRDLP